MRGQVETIGKARWAVRAAGIAVIALICTAAVTWLIAFTTKRAQSSVFMHPAKDPRAMIHVVEISTLVIATLGLLWLTFVTYLVLTCCVGRLSKRAWKRGENALRAISPRLARYTLATAVGIGVSAATLAPAHATGDAEPFDINLSWAGQKAVTVEMTESTNSAREGPATHEQVERVEQVERAEPAEVSGQAAQEPDVVVATGDSLWKITASHLPPDATNSQIDAEWRRWYAENHELIGSDPGLILPGMKLSAPPAPSGGS